MKKALSFLFFCFTLTLFSQQWDWARQATQTKGIQESKDVYSDPSGNVYMIGYNDTTAYYGNTILGKGSFVVKYSSTGNLLWAKDMPGQLQALATDALGNLFLLGNFSNVITIESFVLISQGMSDLYLAKINSTGSIQWVKSYGGGMTDSGLEMEIDKNNNIYIAGTFQDSISFDSINLRVMETNNYGTKLFYLVKINPSGIADWARTSPYNSPSNLYQYHTPQFLCIDKNNNIYITGEYTSFPCYQYYCEKGFILKYDESGTLKMDQRPWMSLETLYGFVVDDNLDILVEYHSGSHYTDCANLIKYDSLMSTKWEIGLGCYSCGSNYTFTYGLSADSLNNCYVMGYFNSSIFLYGQWIVSNGLNDILVAKFDSSGNPIWIKTAGGNGDENYPNYYSSKQTMYVDKAGNCLVTGLFNTDSSIQNDTIAFNNDTLKNDGSWQQIYLAKILNTNSITTDQNILRHHQNTDYKIFPNPSSGLFTIQGPNTNNSTICIYDVLGNCILDNTPIQNNTHQIDISNQAKGIYFVEIISDHQKNVKKISLQ